MLLFKSLIVACASITSVLAAPTDLIERQSGELAKRQALTTSQTGTNGGYYFSFWTDGAAKVTYTNLAGGEYKVTWSGNAGNWVGGKGWNPGAARSVNAPLLKIESGLTSVVVRYPSVERMRLWATATSVCMDGLYANDEAWLAFERNAC